MIDIKRITTVDKELYFYMEQLLVSSFPPEEFRELNELRDYTDNRSNFFNNIILKDKLPVGFITYWDLNKFHYIEHFAIDPQHRNGGFGKILLQNLAQKISLPIVLEVERPEDELAQRRINFYKRQGYELWVNDYMQPPYKAGDKKIPMYMMVYGNLDMNDDYEPVKSIIYKDVYNFME